MKKQILLLILPIILMGFSFEAKAEGITKDLIVEMGDKAFTHLAFRALRGDNALGLISEGGAMSWFRDQIENGNLQVGDFSDVQKELLARKAGERGSVWSLNVFERHGINIQPAVEIMANRANNTDLGDLGNFLDWGHITKDNLSAEQRALLVRRAGLAGQEETLIMYADNGINIQPGVEVMASRANNTDLGDLRALLESGAITKNNLSTEQQELLVRKAGEERWISTLTIFANQGANIQPVVEVMVNRANYSDLGDLRALLESGAITKDNLSAEQQERLAIRVGDVANTYNNYIFDVILRYAEHGINIQPGVEVMANRANNSDLYYLRALLESGAITKNNLSAEQQELLVKRAVEEGWVKTLVSFAEQGINIQRGVEKIARADNAQEELLKLRDSGINISKAYKVLIEENKGNNISYLIQSASPSEIKEELSRAKEDISIPAFAEMFYAHLVDKLGGNEARNFARELLADKIEQAGEEMTIVEFNQTILPHLLSIFGQEEGLEIAKKAVEESLILARLRNNIEFSLFLCNGVEDSVMQKEQKKDYVSFILSLYGGQSEEGSFETTSPRNDRKLALLNEFIEILSIEPEDREEKITALEHFCDPTTISVRESSETLVSTSTIGTTGVGLNTEGAIADDTSIKRSNNNDTNRSNANM